MSQLMKMSERKRRELKAIADAFFDSVMAVEMKARARQAKRLEAKASRS
jgi:transcriptional regulator of aromatic amino acid metabolism